MSEKGFLVKRKPRQRLNVYNNCVGLYFPPQLTRELIVRVGAGEDVSGPFDISIIFVDDATILDLNQEFLHHADLTDVISFNLSESDAIMEGEIYVCLTQAERQAAEYNSNFGTETSRLVIHGFLHLLDYRDDTNSEREEMHWLENRYLNLDNAPDLP